MSVDVAEAIVAANRYMTIATADAAGRPWASPVWFATADGRELFWVSKPEARHSRNIAVRAQVGIVIFDSHVPAGAGSAVYFSADAEEVSGDAIAPGLAVFSAVSVARGLPAWTAEQVGPGAAHRLFRATASERYVLDEHDFRVPVPF
jgi:pyridoxine/pyridoxamine 5'-phosphate oxidase